MTSPSILSAIQRLRGLLTRTEKLRWVGIVFFAFFSSFFEILTASIVVLFAQILSDPISGQKYLEMIGLSLLSPGRIVFYFSIGVGAIYVIKNIAAGAEIFYQNFSIQKMNYNFKIMLLNHYAKADYASYITKNSSQGYQIIVRDVENVFSNGMIALAIMLSEGFVFLGLTGVLIYINSSVAFAILGMGVVLGLLAVKWLLPKFYQLGQDLQEVWLRGGQHLLQFFHGFKEIILMGKRREFIESYQKYSKGESNIQAMKASLNALPRLILETLFVGFFVTVIALLCLNHEGPIQILGVLGGYFYAGFRLMPGINRITNQLNVFKSIIPSIERISTEYALLSNKENYVSASELQFKDRIDFKGVSFRYPGTQKNVISNISFSIERGSSTGIVGKTGSGKSTLIDLILGLLRPHKGSILVDGKFPVNSYQWHHKIGYVPQSIYLIDDTIEKNIVFGAKEIDKSKLSSSIEDSQLSKLIKRLPKGVKTIVGERGIRLSGGERQRIAIARALYLCPELLVFDEATSALDNETEENLMETIYKISQNRTVIMIAHRTSTLKKCNKIIRIEDGKISNGN